MVVPRVVLQLSHLAALTSIAAVLACPPCLIAVAAAGEQLAPNVERALRTNSTDLSPLTVAWERKRSSSENVQTVLRIVGFPRTATEFLAPEKVRLMWNQGKFYTQFWRTMPTVGDDGKIDIDSPMQIQETERSCDGTEFYIGNPSKRRASGTTPAVVRIQTLSQIASSKGHGRLLLVADYLHAAGFQMPQTAAELKNGQHPISLLLKNLSDGAKLTRASTETLDGHVFVSLETVGETEKHVFLLDPDRNYALRRRLSYTASGQLTAVVDCADFMRLPGKECCLPRLVTTQMYYPKYSPAKPLVIEKMFVSELGNAPTPDAQFVVKYGEPGSHVVDYTLPGAEKKPNRRIAYQVPADPRQLDKVIDAVTRGSTGGQAARSSKMPLIIWINLIAIAVVACVILVAKLRRRSGDGN